VSELSVPDGFVHVNGIVVVVVPAPCANPVGAVGSVKTFVKAVDAGPVPLASTASTSKQYEVADARPVTTYGSATPG
jgi:hypothetical protein